MLTDLQKKFTNRFPRKLFMYPLLKLPPHIHYVATLPCEIRHSYLSTPLSSRTGPWHIEHGRSLICWSRWRQNFIPHCPLSSSSPDQTLSTMVWWIYKTTFPRIRPRTWKSYSNTSKRNEMVLISEWSMLQLGNGTRLCKPAFQLTEDILNMHF